MKKKVAIGLTMLLVLSFSSMAFAASADVPDWYQEMRDWRQERVETALDEGLLTEEQAEWQQERWEAMDAYRLENGFAGGFGLCHGGFGGGFGGRGMMGGFGGPFGGFNQNSNPFTQTF